MIVCGYSFAGLVLIKSWLECWKPGLQYTCQLSRIMLESHTCRSKIVISRIQTNFSRLTDNSKCILLKNRLNKNSIVF